MAKADIQAGRAYVSLFVKNGIPEALKEASEQLNGFGSSVMGIGAKIGGMGAAIVGSLTGAIMHFADAGSALNDLSARTGIGTTALAELGYAAGMTGTEIASFESGVKKMQKNLGGIGPESKKAQEALAAMGLSMDMISGLSPEDQFQAIAESIGSIQDPSQKAAAAMAVFGGSGTDLIPMMENIRELRAEARELGIAPSPESIAAADAIGDAIDRVKAVVSSAVFEIGAAIAPMASDFLDAFLKVSKAVRNFVQQNKAMIVTVAKIGLVLMAAGGALITIGGAFIAAGAAIGGVVSVMSAIAAAGSVAMSVLGVVGAVIGSILSPVGVLVALLGAGVYAWARFTQGGQAAVSGLSTIIGETFGAISATVTETLGGIIAAIQAGDLALAGQIAMVGLRLVMMQGLEAIHSLFGDAWGTLASQLLSGDFAGAWSTFGSMILDTMAGVASGMVTLFSNAANAVMSKWQQTVNKISDYILESASQGGVMGWALEQISGVNMQEEAARAARLNAQAGAMGLAQDAGIVTSAEYQDPALEAMKAKVAAAGEAAKAAMDASTEATGTALADATAGSAAETSESVKALQAELAALQAEASNKLAAVKSGQAESGGKAAGGMFGPGGSSGGKSSGASFNLAQLAMSSGRGVEYKQLAATEKSAKLQEQQVDQMGELVAAVKGWSLHHA